MKKQTMASIIIMTFMLAGIVPEPARARLLPIRSAAPDSQDGAKTPGKFRPKAKKRDAKVKKNTQKMKEKREQIKQKKKEKKKSI